MLKKIIFSKFMLHTRPNHHICFHELSDIRREAQIRSFS